MGKSEVEELGHDIRRMIEIYCPYAKIAEETAVWTDSNGPKDFRKQMRVQVKGKTYQVLIRQEQE